MLPLRLPFPICLLSVTPSVLTQAAMVPVVLSRCTPTPWGRFPLFYPFSTNGGRCLLREMHQIVVVASPNIDFATSFFTCVCLIIFGGAFGRVQPCLASFGFLLKPEITKPGPVPGPSLFFDFFVFLPHWFLPVHPVATFSYLPEVWRFS